MASFGQAAVAEKQSEFSRLKEADRIRRDQREALRQKVEEGLAANATAATLRNLERPVIDRLLAQGKLTADHHRAATQIERVYLEITRHLMAKGSRYDREIGGGSSTGFIPNIFTCGYQDRFKPWADEEARCTFAGTNRFDLVLKMVVDNYGPTQLEQMCGSDRRTVLNAIRVSLQRFAEIAGWVQPEGLPLRPATKAA